MTVSVSGQIPTILVIAATDVATDARVDRQIRFLRNSYRVACAAVGKPSAVTEQFIGLKSPRLAVRSPWQHRLRKAYRLSMLGLRRYEAIYWGQPWVRDAQAKLQDVRADVIIANDLDTLPLAIKVARGAPVVFDAHEFYPGQEDDRTYAKRCSRRQANHLCRRYMVKAARVITVSQGIADEYQRRYRVCSSVLENCPAFQHLEPSAVCDSGFIDLVHHGVCQTSRGLERLVEMMQHLDARFRLHFMLMGDPTTGFQRELRARAASNPRIHFLEPVAPQEIAAAINRFDLGVYLLPPVNLNHDLALPNKFFDFIQARLGIAIGPSMEMAKIVRQHDLGLVAEECSATALAALLNGLTSADVIRFKRNAHGVARRYCSEVSGSTLIAIIEDVLAAARLNPKTVTA